jgi:pilus assembly protein CpaC
MRSHYTDFARSALVVLLGLGLSLLLAQRADAQVGGGSQPLLVNVSKVTQRVEMVVNTSRILTLGKKIPRAQVNNPDVLELTPLSPTQIQISAVAPGVTQVNLWDEEDNVQSIDVFVFGDAQELVAILRTQFPKSALKVVPLSDSVVISGFVSQPSEVSTVVRIAENYYPKVINNISVGGVQQVMLHVRVMEVSRTKLRSMGFDFSVSRGGNFFVSGAAGLIAPSGAALGGDTMRFGLVNAGANFLGTLELLQQKNLVKVLAEPTLVTVSGRPARFLSGGEFPILVPGGFGTVGIEYKAYGTEVDFVPIVMGNGRIRLEIRPQVSELDESRGVTINDLTVPALTKRFVDTGVEMSAGQTLAIAGLVQNRIESEHKGVPVLSDLPYLGAAFRRVQERNNEVELLILVTPELVEAVDAHQVPQIGPGMNSDSPTDWDLFMRGHIEVPRQQGPQRQFQGPLPPQSVPLPPAEEVQPGPSTQPPSSARRQAVPVQPRRQHQAATQPAASSRLRPMPSQLDRGAASSSRRNSRYNQPSTVTATSKNGESLGPGLIGPVGYDVQK